MTIAFIWLLLQKRVPIPSSCIHTIVDFLVHDNVELRKVFIGYANNSHIPIIFVPRSPRNPLLLSVACRNHRASFWRKHSIRSFTVPSTQPSAVPAIEMTISGWPSMTTSLPHHSKNGKRPVFWTRLITGTTSGQRSFDIRWTNESDTR